MFEMYTWAVARWFLKQGHATRANQALCRWHVPESTVFCLTLLYTYHSKITLRVPNDQKYILWLNLRSLKLNEKWVSDWLDAAFIVQRKDWASMVFPKRVLWDMYALKNSGLEKILTPKAFRTPRKSGRPRNSEIELWFLIWLLQTCIFTGEFHVLCTNSRHLVLIKGVYNACYCHTCYWGLTCIPLNQNPRNQRLLVKPTATYNQSHQISSSKLSERWWSHQSKPDPSVHAERLYKRSIWVLGNGVC